MFNLEFVGSSVEIGFCSSFDAECLVAEVDGVGIHFEDSFLVIECLNLGGKNPLLHLHDDHLDPRNIAQQSPGVLAGAHLEHVLHQLLCDGRCATGLAMNDEIFSSTCHSVEVDAPVIIESFIFGVDEQAVEHGVDLLILNWGAIFLVVLTYLLPVGAKDD